MAIRGLCGIGVVGTCYIVRIEHEFSNPGIRSQVLNSSNFLNPIDPFPIIGFYLYHVIPADQSNNWTTSGMWSCNNLQLILNAFHLYLWRLKHKPKGKWQLYVAQLYMMTKRVNYISYLSNLRWTKPWRLLFKWYVYRIYCHNYFRCCWRRPWWDDVFPCGSTLFINFPNKNVQK